MFFIKSPSIRRSDAISDVSWPNCNTKQVTYYTNGIIGVNDGLDFTGNPCLSTETSWYEKYALYINTGYAGNKMADKFRTSPLSCDPNNSTCLAYDWGYHATEYAVDYANSMNAHSGEWWLDVETINSWTRNSQVNRASISGALAALHKILPFATTGIYSTSDQWNHLTNSWQIREPIWYAIGEGDNYQARLACTTAYQFTGESLWLVQYTASIDYNVTCSNQFSNKLSLF